MFIKELEIFGFKSFAKRTKFSFEEGISAIVGPNGCGKSNIVEAIKWVLGEQNPSLLRCHTMTDVIFNGTTEKKPLSIAEVSLVISNHKKLLPLDFTEIAIMRRLFNSGECEYYINRNSCRLKDIRTIFLGTGVGKYIYSIIDQGKVDIILDNKPNMRRIIFEEAAGITKYKVKKEEAESKLNATESNLLRINDLISEIQCQLDATFRQAKRAKQYVQLTETLKSTTIKEYTYEYALLKDTYNSTTPKWSMLKEEIERLSAEMHIIEDRIQTEKDAHSHLQKEESALQIELNAFSKRIEKEKGILLQSKEKCLHLNSAIERIYKDIGDSVERETKIASELASLQIQEESLQAELNNQKTVLDTETRLLTKMKITISQDTTSLEEAKIGVIDQLNTIASINNEITSIEIQKKNLSFRMGRLSEEERGLKKKIEDIETELKRKDLEFSDKETVLYILKGELTDAQQKKVSLEERLTEIEKLITTETAELKAIAAKLQTVQKFQDEQLLASGGVKAILESNLMGMCGRLVDIFTVIDPVYDQAIEGALQGHLGGIITQTHLNAHEAIYMLKTNQKEKVRFFPKTIRSKIKMNDYEGVKKGLDLIRCDPEYQSIFEYLLGDVFVVDSLEDAYKIARETNHNDYSPTTRVVTLDGDIVYLCGIIEGGAIKPPQLRIISSKRIVANLIKEEQVVTERLLNAEWEKKDLKIGLIELTGKIADTQLSLHSIEMNKSRLLNDISLANQMLIELRERSSIIYEELKESDRERTNFEQRLIEITADLKVKERERREKLKWIEDLSGRNSLLSARLRAQEELVTHLKVNLAGLKEKSQSTTTQIVRFKEDASGLTMRMLKLREEVQVFEHSKKDEERNCLETEENIQKSQQELVEREKVFTILKDKYHSIEDRLIEMTIKLKEKRERYEELNKELHSIELDRNRYNLQMEGVYNQALKEYNICLEKLLVKESLEEIPGLRDKVIHLKAKIEGFGQVNLMAPTEYNELKERLDFMNSQREDLLKAKDDLKRLIDEIESGSKKIFMDTYSAIRANFSEVYQKLFDGGLGELSLINADSDDPGVEIMASPKGKKLRNIGLLSGGEKSLTAIGLLFAIFMRNPSPFCILDEVDAALDESNTVRFSKFLKDFTNGAQFLLITHNRLTIETATTLYGITMEEPGVSSVVSLKL